MEDPTKTPLGIFDNPPVMHTYVVVGHVEDPGGHEHVILSRDIKAVSSAAARNTFIVQMRKEVGDPLVTVDTVYGPYAEVSR